MRRFGYMMTIRTPEGDELRVERLGDVTRYTLKPDLSTDDIRYRTRPVLQVFVIDPVGSILTPRTIVCGKIDRSPHCTDVTLVLLAAGQLEMIGALPQMFYGFSIGEILSATRHGLHMPGIWEYLAQDATTPVSMVVFGDGGRTQLTLEDRVYVGGERTVAGLRAACVGWVDQISDLESADGLRYHWCNHRGRWLAGGPDHVVEVSEQPRDLTLPATVNLLAKQYGLTEAGERFLQTRNKHLPEGFVASLRDQPQI
jgi:hypothetical protein